MLTFGNTPVPYVASWSDEESFRLDQCPHAGALAICQKDAPGHGKPLFGKPHAGRQREVIIKGLCDLCAKPLRNSTKVSLSHARPVAHSANGWEILQVEPLLHKACALISMRHCPALRRDIREGSLRVRQVTRYAVQIAKMSAEYGRQIAGDERIALGHAKVQLIQWIDRDETWLSPEAVRESSRDSVKTSNLNTHKEAER